jgi:hypothetical protein
LLSANIKFKIHGTKILPVVSYGCVSWLLTLRGHHWLRVFENRVLSRIFGPKRDDVIESGENYVMRSLVICIPQQIFR